MPGLALFDLDHTLLSGDSDVLWCDFLIDCGELDRATFGPRNADMAARYQAGTVGVQEFSEFFIGTLAGRTPVQWAPLRQRFAAERVFPRIPADARDLVERHRAAGDCLVLTTATNRFLTELTAQHLGIAHLIATDCALDAHGRFTGALTGTANMREGKVTRLAEWLQSAGHPPLPHWPAGSVVAYSDSLNDLPLLSAAHRAVAVDPDPRLAQIAAERGWTVLRLRR